MEFLAYITKGLDRVVQHELLDAVPETDVRCASEKYIIFDAPESSVDQLLNLRTVDDLHQLLLFRDCEAKPDTADVIEAFPYKKLYETKELLQSIRDLDDTVSVTSSRYRNDNVEKEKIKTELGEEIGERLSLTFTERDHSNFDIRVHVEQQNIIISCRLTKKPLYYRSYKSHSREGSLKPSIAAALVRLTDPKPGARLVDNFCGVGTILCEGAVQNLEPYGGDVDEEAVRFAQDHLRSLSRQWVRNVYQLDAKNSKLPDDYYDLAVSNVPWGEQLELKAVDLYSKAIPEYARILSDDGSIVLLGPKPDLVEKHLKENFPDHSVGQFRLGFLGQHPWVNFAYPESTSLNLV